MTDMDMSQYLGAFLDETDDNLQRLDDLLLALEKNMVDMDVINEIFRAAHTLKGMAGTMGFTQMMGLTHAMEDRLDEARKETLPLTETDMNLLFSGLDSLQAMADSIRGGGNDAHIDVSAMVSALRHEGPAPEAPAVAAPEEEKKEEGPVLSEKDIEWIQKSNEASMTPFSVHVTLSQSCLLKAARAYMVVNRLEELGNLYKTTPPSAALENEEFEWDFMVYIASSHPADELKKAVEKISDIASADVEEIKGEAASAGAAPAEPAPEETAPAAEAAAPAPTPAPSPSPSPAASSAPAPAAPAAKKDGAKKASQTVRVDIGRLDKLMNLVGELVISRARIERLVQEARLREFDDPLSQLGRISGDIQELVTKLRMVPVSFTFDRFPRLIRDLGKTLNKNVELVLEGEDTELDRTVIDEIGDPMVHLIRNSMDHGIEHPAERKALGKPEKGIL